MSKTKACFIGLGYIGLPTSIIAATSNLQIIGVDTNPHIVETVNKGELHIVEPGLEELAKKAVNSGNLKAQAQPEESDVFVIVVPTPFKDDHEPDIQHVIAATNSIIPFLKEDDLYIIESTSPVGTTEQMAELIYTERPELKDKINIAYCPERVLPGNIIHELIHNDRVIGGLTPASTEKASEFYKQFVKGKTHKTNTRTAEMCKLIENASRDVQIAFANELSIICDKADINVWELIELANKHPRVNILQPSSGVGGHCIAVDPYFITSAFPLESQIIGKARELNNYKSFWCAEKTQSTITDFELKHGREPVVALMGLAYKPNIDDLRESPAKYITTRVIQGYSNADYFIVEPNIKDHNVFKLTDYQDAYKQADIVVFLVAHEEFKALEWKDDKIILDFAGVFKR